MTPPSSKPDRRAPARIAFLPFVVVLLATPLAAQQPAGAVRGRVSDERSREGVPSAVVTVLGTRAGTRTDDTGSFVLPDVRAGAGILRVRALGYKIADRAITVLPGETTTVIVVLEPAPVQLERVLTTATPRERTDFETSPDIGRVTLRGSTVRTVPPIAEPDVLRAVQLLPGVTSRSDYTAGYNVRGGESDQNLVLLDGIPVYNPFHLFGLFGTFIDETVGEVNLLVGGFPATYGGRLSSVLEVTSADEARQGVHGSAAVSLLSSSASVGGMLPDARTSWGIAARRTYADVVAGAITEDGLPYHFYDGQLRARHIFPSGGELAFTAYGGSDLLDGDFATFDNSRGVDESDNGSFEFGWGNRLAGLSWTQPIAAGARMPLGNGQFMSLGDSARFQAGVSWTQFRTDLDLGGGSLTFRNRVDELRGTTAFTWYDGTHARRIGLEASQIGVHYGLQAQTGTELFSLRQSPLAVAASWDDQSKLAPRLLARWGARVEHVTGARWTGISPRASFRFLATPDLAFSIAGGRYTQWLHAFRNEDVPVRIFDSWVGSDEFTPVSIADHLVAGAERWFGARRFARLEGWGKRYDRLTEANDADDPRVRGDEFNFPRGTSYGADLLLRQVEGGRVSGWVSYGWAVSAREQRGSRYAPAQDRRHTLNAVATLALPKRFSVGARLGVATGTPFTDVEGQIIQRVYDPATHSWDTDIASRRLQPVGGDRNGARYPSCARLDLSGSRRAQWRGAVVEPYASIVNTTNSRCVFVYSFDYVANPPTRQAFSQFPILPSLGMRVTF